MSIEPRASSRRDNSLGVCYATTVLVSAFLVFQVQPVISRFILPWFGGSPAVWTTCMLFFQVVLFAGYAYAHLVTRYLKISLQGPLHLLLIIGALWALPITPDAAWKPIDSNHPAWRILCLLAMNVGVPYFLLSSTGPLIQSWFSQTHEGRSPYRLYALSNVGSLLALVSYPFLVEPMFAAGMQGRLWSLGFVAFALCCTACTFGFWRRRFRRTVANLNSAVETSDRGTTPGLKLHLAWLALAACASMMLLAVTNHVSQDVAVIPFLWVAPLSLYLISFIICFEKEHWYRPQWFALGAIVSIVAVSLVMLAPGGVHLLVETFVYFAALFFICMLCHGELVRLKPAPRHLTAFYLMSAAGGAVGGILVGLVAPLVLSTYLEFNLGLLVCYVLALMTLGRDKSCRWFTTRTALGLSGGLAAFVGLLMVVRAQVGAVQTDANAVSRNFYGVLSINELDAGDPERHRIIMRHGRILHGMQYVDAALRHIPTSYYNEQAGAGLTLLNPPHKGPLRVGVVGLGCGTLAAYGRPGDYYRFYEINPEVIRLARDNFTYLHDCPAQMDLVLGDARLSMEHESPQRFDILILDAFSGDAIPTHLLTREAFDVYSRHLASDGVIATHISNRHLDLAPVMQGLADCNGVELARVDTVVTLGGEEVRSIWTLLTHNDAFLAQPALRAAVGEPTYAKSLLWTDDYSNLFEVLQWRLRN